MKTSQFLSPAPPNYKWPQCPEADHFIRERIAEFLIGHSFAEHLAGRMQEVTSTDFQVWVDHLILPKAKFKEEALRQLGFERDKEAVTPPSVVAFWHPFTDLPRLLLSTKSVSLSCAIMVENISDFELAHGLSLTIAGAPLSLYREARIPGDKGELRVVERHGGKSFVPDQKDRAARYLTGVEAWLHRPRHFPRQREAMNHALKLARTMVASLGAGMAAWAFLEAERRYWQNRNRAGQLQKARQDKLGLGWANHDHHTFRSSRPAFPALIKILQTFGFKKRERYFAGAEAGWGAQIMEQPESRLVIFADVDLAPSEISIDFSAVAMKELDKPGTVGLWCALHGESLLGAGMHHLEAKFDFERMRHSLESNGVNFMPPFSDFPHLRQAFSEGEWWAVPPDRLERLRSSNRISQEAYDRIKQKGAVGSHLENLQRRDGFKGFNQKGVSDIIREVNPEAQALKGPGHAS
jgi:hypothetical protein